MNDVTGLQGAFSTAMNHDDFQSFKIILGNESFFSRVSIARIYSSFVSVANFVTLYSFV